MGSMIVRDYASRLISCEWGRVVLITFRETVKRNLLLLFSFLGQGFYNGVATYLIKKITKINQKVHCFIN